MPIIEYKCPNCGSGMAFDSVTGTLLCGSCGRSDDIEQIADPLVNLVFTEGEVREYHCHSCGAVIMTETETTATLCSFCGSSVVLADRLTGKLAPAKVIPFMISKEEAIQTFKKWCKNGRLTPHGFMSANRIKSITGMYVPFWLYDLHNKVEVHGQGTKIRSYTSGDYEYTETSHFRIYRQIRVNYSGLPVDAAEKMNDELMDKLEPFHYDQLKIFKTPYLAGYIAEKYSYDHKQLIPRMKGRVSKYIDDYIHSTVSEYSSVSITDRPIETHIKQADYVLLPVWVIHYNHKNLEHSFAMNGQTGKVVGKPPISKAKVTAWFAGISGVSLLSLKLISWMIGGVFW
jgi:DNA-directed RNA polymerase subunit RPC12/RpoP